MLVAGFGGGVVAENVPPSILEVDVLELEPKVMEANRMVSNQRAMDPLKDTRINIIYNDARSALQLTEKKYDIVVSQPSHPWTAGASHLYTQQYMQLVEDHLSDNGVFLQWMNIRFTDEYLLRSLSATLAATFKYVRIYQFSPAVLYFLASNNELEIEQDIITSGQPFADYPEYYADIGLSSVESVLSGLAMDNDGVREFSRLGKIITDNYNMLGTRSTLAMESNSSLSYERLIEFIVKHSPLYSDKSWIHNEASGLINYSHLVDEVKSLNTPIFANRIYEILAAKNEVSFLGVRAKQLAKNSQKEEAKNQTLRALQKSPTNQQLKYQLVSLYLNGPNLYDLPPQVLQHYKSLAPDARAVIDNLNNLDIEKGNPKQLKDIEDLLKNVKQSDEWFSIAKQMRALWRTKLAQTNLDQKLAAEAIRYIDRALIDNYDQWTHELRIAAAYIAGDEAAMQFSTGFFLTSAQKQLEHYNNPINMIGTDNKAATLKQLTRIIELFSIDSPISRGARDQLLQKLYSVRNGYSKLEEAADDNYQVNN